MKIGFLIIAYHKENQLEILIDTLGEAFGFENIFLHIDKKSKINIKNLHDRINNKVTTISKRKVYWGGFSQLESTIDLIQIATQSKDYDFLVLLSGQDFPVVTKNCILDFLKSNVGSSFISCTKFPNEKWNYKNGTGRYEWPWFMDANASIRLALRLNMFVQKLFIRFNLTMPNKKNLKFFGGSDWWILPGDVAKYCMKTFTEDRGIRRLFHYTFIPSEMYFQTVIMNSEFSVTVKNDNVRYIPWSNPKSAHPDTVTIDMIPQIAEGNYLFARKLDLDFDSGVLYYFKDRFEYD